MSSVKLPTLWELRSLLRRTAREHGIPSQFKNTWQHSTVDWRFSDRIAKLAMGNGYRVNRKLLKIGCYAHDAGRTIIGGKGSSELRPAVYHFYEGYRLMQRHGYPALARICVSHGGGSGIDRVTNKRHGFINKDFFPRSIEEKIIAYADALATYSKRRGPYIGPFQVAYRRFKKYPGAGPRLLKVRGFIHRITKDTSL